MSDNQEEKVVGYITVRPPSYKAILSWAKQGMKVLESLEWACMVADLIMDAKFNGSKQVTIIFEEGGTMSFDDGLPEFKTGDRVNVCRMAGDIFARDFTGHIVRQRDELFTVEDMEGEQWDVDKIQLTLDTE